MEIAPNKVQSNSREEATGKLDNKANQIEQEKKAEIVDPHLRGLVLCGVRIVLCGVFCVLFVY